MILIKLKADWDDAKPWWPGALHASLHPPAHTLTAVHPPQAHPHVSLFLLPLLHIRLFLGQCPQSFTCLSLRLHVCKSMMPARPSYYAHARMLFLPNPRTPFFATRIHKGTRPDHSPPRPVTYSAPARPLKTSTRLSNTLSARLNAPFQHVPPFGRPPECPSR